MKLKSKTIKKMILCIFILAICFFFLTPSWYIRKHILYSIPKYPHSINWKVTTDKGTFDRSPETSISFNTENKQAAVDYYDSYLINHGWMRKISDKYAKSLGGWQAINTEQSTHMKYNKKVLFHNYEINEYADLPSNTNGQTKPFIKMFLE